MRYVQLRAFHNVAIHGGFSRAAKALHLTQPAISDQIRKLEEHYDVLLFNRHKKQVSITSQGAALLEITNRMFENERQAQELLSESHVLSAGNLRIIADSAHHVNPILGQFRTSYPGIKIAMRAGNTADVIEALYAYEADIGVLGEAPKNSEINILHLGSSPIIAFAAKGFMAQNPAALSFVELAKMPLIFRESGSKTRQKLEIAARKSGVKLKPVIEVEGREALREIVASKAGIGFVSAAEYGHDDRFVPISINAPPIRMDEALICLRERSRGKLVEAFMALAAAHLAP
ncbi:MAG: LysR substrate-binding domain-containing protein [Paracoccaceae bacterium]